VRAPVWILIPILAAGCSGGSADRAARTGSHQREQRGAPSVQKPAPRAQAKHGRVAPKKVTHHAKVTKQASRKAKPHPKKPKPRQQQHRAALPWRPNGTSLVAHVRVRRIAVYGSPRAKRPKLTLSRHDWRGTQRAFLVRANWHDWVRVYLPTRPNGSLGWVRRQALRVYTDRYRLVIRVRRHRLQLWEKRHLVATYPVAVGTSSTPTPRGVFYVVELLQPPDPGGTYGPYSFGLSAHSNVLRYFAGGDGRVGLHGTNEPGLIGSSVSHGCIRLRNEAVRRLARILPLGTPVYIRS